MRLAHVLMLAGFLMALAVVVLDSWADSAVFPFLATALLITPVLFLSWLHARRRLSRSELRRIVASLGDGWRLDSYSGTASTLIEGQTVSIGPQFHLQVSSCLNSKIAGGGATFQPNTDEADVDELSDGPRLLTGDDRFDRCWIVHTRDPHRIRAIFDDEARRYLAPHDYVLTPPLVAIVLTDAQVRLCSPYRNLPGPEWILTAARFAARIARVYESGDAYRQFLSEIAEKEPSEEVRRRARESLMADESGGLETADPPTGAQ
jgi:hypothetical protein